MRACFREHQTGDVSSSPPEPPGSRLLNLVKWTEWRTPSPDPSERCAEVGEFCNLTILRGINHLLRPIELKWPLRITFQTGSNVPAHCSASGKLFLALPPAAKRERIIRQITLEKFTENTIIDAAVLRKSLPQSVDRAIR